MYKVSPGSFPFFLIGIKLNFILFAKAAPNTNPLDSIPAIASVLPLYCFWKVDKIYSKASGFSNNGHISLKIMPFFGKFG